MAESGMEYYQGQNLCMGSLIQVHAFHPAGEQAWMRVLADRFFDALEKDEARLSVFRRESVISQINRESGGDPVPVDEDTFALLEAARTWWEFTGGLFDITVGVLMRHYGYLGKAAAETESELPVASGPGDLTDLVGGDKLELDSRNRTVRLARQGMLLDLGGFAKGWCAERRAGIFTEAGLRDFLVCFGRSTVVARGAPPEKDGWLMELESPLGGPVGAREFTATDCAISVSGSYRRTLEGADGSTVRHIMNPLTLEPVKQVRQVIVAGPSADQCEALSTAFLIQGAPRGVISLEECPDFTVYFDPPPD